MDTGGSCTTNVKLPRRRVVWQGSFEIHCGHPPNYSLSFMSFCCQNYFAMPNSTPYISEKRPPVDLCYFRASEDTSRTGLKEPNPLLALSAAVCSSRSSTRHSATRSPTRTSIWINSALSSYCS